MRSFAGRTALVTGAAGGIGQALCARLVAAGAQVAAVDIDEERVGALAKDLGPSCLPLVCDIRNEAECGRVIDETRSALGPVEVLINNAGLSHHSRFADTAPEVLRRIMDVNFFGSVNMTRAALTDLVDRRGVIAVISSVAGIAPLLDRSAYAASKHALHGMFESLAAEVRPLGVGVVMVCPSFVRTEIDSRALSGAGDIGIETKHVAGRLMEPDTLAEQILDGIAHRRRRLIPSMVGKVSLALSAFAPGLFERVMVRSVRRVS